MSARTPEFVGERLRQARAIREMTSVALASRIGISPATLTHYERGRHTPTPYHFAQIAKALDFKPEFFSAAVGTERTRAGFVCTLTFHSHSDDVPSRRISSGLDA